MILSYKEFLIYSPNTKISNEKFETWIHIANEQISIYCRRDFSKSDSIPNSVKLAATFIIEDIVKDPSVFNINKYAYLLNPYRELSVYA